MECINLNSTSNGGEQNRPMEYLKAHHAKKTLQNMLVFIWFTLSFYMRTIKSY